MELSIQVNKLGPIQNTELEITIPSLTVFYGSNISGKSLLGITTVALLQAYSIIFGYERLGRLLGSTDLLDLVSTILGDDPLDIRESIRIEKGKVVEEPRTLIDVWPNLSPEERLFKYIGVMLLNNSLVPYYGWGGSSIDIDVVVELGSAVIKARGILPVAIESDIVTDRLKNFVLEVESGRKLAIGLALMDPYNEYWQEASPSARLVREVLRRSDIHVLLLKRGSKLEALYNGFIRALKESLKLSGYRSESISLDIDATGIIFKIDGVEIHQDLFSKGLRTLVSILSYAICAHILSAIELNTVVYLDEPESSLDTFVVYELPLILAETLGEDTAFVLSTHREEVVMSIENLKRRKAKIVAEVYEFQYDENSRCFKPKKASYDEVLEKLRIERLEKLERRILESYALAS